MILTIARSIMEGVPPVTVTNQMHVENVRDKEFVVEYRGTVKAFQSSSLAFDYYMMCVDNQIKIVRENFEKLVDVKV